MATGDEKRAVMTDDIDNAQSSYPVMSLRAVDAAPDAAHTNNLISSAALAAKASSLAAGMAIIATGNTHAAVTKGQYVYIQNHATLPEGMYEATANIAANGTLSTSNVTAKNEGAANALKAALEPVQAALNTFTAYGFSYGGQTSVNITLPERAAFNEYAPLFVICTYRGQEASDKNGIAVLKYVNIPLIAYKAGATSLTAFAYDATTRVLTLSCEQYMTFLVIGRLSEV